MLNDYVLGTLYGDGYLQLIGNREVLFFSTTHKEIADKIIMELVENGIDYGHFQRTFEADTQKENYELLEVIQIKDQKFLSDLKENGYDSDSVRERIKFSSDFIRGYIETKGTLFQYYGRGSEFWRLSISGNYEDVAYIKELFENHLGVKVGAVLHRKEREAYGILSSSYRFSTQSRGAVAKIIEFIDGNDMTAYLKKKIKGFDQFHANTPFNAKRKVFKHYRSATLFMAREMDFTIKGIRGSMGTKGFKPVFLWEGDIPVLCFKGWEWAFHWTSAEYEKRMGFNAPSVE